MVHQQRALSFTQESRCRHVHRLLAVAGEGGQGARLRGRCLGRRFHGGVRVPYMGGTLKRWFLLGKILGLRWLVMENPWWIVVDHQ